MLSFEPMRRCGRRSQTAFTPICSDRACVAISVEAPFSSPRGAFKQKIAGILAAAYEEERMRTGTGSDAAAASASPSSTVARYEALIRVSEALRAYHDRDTLFRSLARELRPVVRFSFLGLGLYDEH